MSQGSGPSIAPVLVWVAWLPDTDSPAPAARSPRGSTPSQPAACNMVLQLARLVPGPIWWAVLRFPRTPVRRTD